MMNRQRHHEAGRGVVLALSWMVISFLVLPIWVIFPVSFTDTRSLALPEHDLSLHIGHASDQRILAGRHLAKRPDRHRLDNPRDCIGHARGHRAMATCGRFKSLIFGLMMLPLVVPTIVYAIGLYRYLIDLGLLNSKLGVVLAHAVTGLPYVVITVSAALSNFDPRLEQAARNLGATTSQTIRWIIVPNVLPGVLSGAVFAYAHSWDELVIVLFVGGRAVLTLPRLVWEGIHDNLDPVIAVVSAAMVAFTLLLMVAEILLRRLQERRA